MTPPFVLQRTPAQWKAVLTDPLATHYAALGVSPGALDPVTLAAARRALMLLFHPDRWQNVTPAGEEFPNRRAHEFAARVNAAHRALSDARERAAYDATLRTLHSPCAACVGAGFKGRQRGFTGAVKVRCATCAGSGWVLKGKR